MDGPVKPGGGIPGGALGGARPAPGGENRLLLPLPLPADVRTAGRSAAVGVPPAAEDVPGGGGFAGRGENRGHGAEIRLQLAHRLQPGLSGRPRPAALGGENAGGRAEKLSAPALRHHRTRSGKNGVPDRKAGRVPHCGGVRAPGQGHGGELSTGAPALGPGGGGRHHPPAGRADGRGAPGPAGGVRRAGERPVLYRRGLLRPGGGGAGGVHRPRLHLGRVPRHGGGPAAIQALERRVVAEWLPTSGYEYAEGPDVEVYLDPECTKFEVWIPVVKAKG